MKEGSENEREREKGSEESNRQWIRVSYRGLKGSSLREARGAREYFAPTFLSDDEDDVDVDENKDIDGE